MTIHSFASDLSDRIPEMARDGKLNNQKLIEQMLTEFLEQYDKQKTEEFITINGDKYAKPTHQSKNQS